MAAIDPNQTQPVAPEQAAAAAANGGARRRTRPGTPTQPAAPAAPTDQAVPTQGLDAATLTQVLAGLGYGNQTQGPTTVAHRDDEGALIELVDSGVVRIPIPEAEGEVRVWRLRPPLFGEHKRIRGALAETLTEIDKATIVYARASVEANAAKASARLMDEPAKSEAMFDAKQAQRAADDAADEAVEKLMRPWWQLVFEVLEKDGPHEIPDEFGPWLLDHGLAADIVNHWRTSPRAPGR
jgi:hypothetical protein